MSVERTLALVACGLCLGTAALAEEQAVPDAEFLEYLGMWEESDEDWLVLEDLQAMEVEERSEPAPEGEESTEKEDES
ncbi:MAG: hypothetical protein OEY37_02815 [Gammaproteobacteria bacterium]|nr:hypothetical protein [Gammaproteobacteria bacterium]MDH5618763.1 hypothetical protein [Gammaproteobacteria bacterium]